MDYSEYLEFAKGIAIRAGEIMLKYFNAEDISKYKGDRTIVTLADTEINSYLIEKVTEKYPSHSIDGEEEQSMNQRSDYIWVCDPVDGTAQFARGVTLSVFSLALVVAGVSVLGVVYDPFAGNLYYAVKGLGAFKNDNKTKLHVSDIALGDMRSVINYDMWEGADFDIYKAVVELCKSNNYMLSIGSCVRGSMAVADGHYVAHIFPGTVRKHCDIAAVKIIVEEAGGVVKNFYGEDDRMDGDIKGAIVCNKVVYADLLQVLKKIFK